MLGYKVILRRKLTDNIIFTFVFFGIAFEIFAITFGHDALIMFPKFHRNITAQIALNQAWKVASKFFVVGPDPGSEQREKQVKFGSNSSQDEIILPFLRNSSPRHGHIFKKKIN